MIITINNQDYSSALATTPALEIVRTLNKPQQCNFALELGGGYLPLPTRDQSVTVAAQNGTVLFTGYLVSDPLQELLGQGTSGPVYRTHLAAQDQAYALDRQPLPWLNNNVQSGGTAQPAGTMLGTITSRLSADGISTEGLAGGPAVGSFSPEPGTTWSHNAGMLASSARCAYRVHDGVLTLTPVGTVAHTLDGSTLAPAGIVFKTNRVLANDVTLTGAEEPACYALDLFQGDGATTIFDLSRSQFAVKGQTLLDDAFTASALNLQTWQVSDPGSHFSLSANGLAISGGTGSDGQTTVCMIDPVELGGSFVMEAGSVMLAAGDGILCGLYSGTVDLGNCFAGFRVRSSNGALLLVPVVNGVETGTIFTATLNHAYLLRMRLHFPELIRGLATYYSLGADGVLARGGGLTDSACAVEFELQDSAAAANTPATVLYDGSVAATPATAIFCGVNSTDLQSSTGYFSVTRPNTAWVTSIPPGGTERTRRIGLAAEGAECHVSAGKLTFYTAATPAAGELIKLRYRTQQRSVARLASTPSQQQEAASGLPAVAQWQGKVEKPKARCSADCEAAAQAVLDFATNRDAAWEARATGANLHQLATGDVWPGDTVTMAEPFSGANAPAELMVRAITVRNGNSQPELLEYQLSLANEWADCLSVTLENTPALDAVLPTGPASAMNAVAPNIAQADVSTLTAANLAVNANAALPSGGGVEVRRQDAGWGGGQQGLVVRSSVPTITLPRAAEREQFFLRMYDGSTPPLYSRVSAAIFTDVPLN